MTSRGGSEDAQRVAAPSTARTDENAVHPSVLHMRAVGAGRSVQDAELIAATAAVVEAVRGAVLERRGLVGVELGKTQAVAVEQEVRNLAVAELQLAIGLGLTEARTMVTAAVSPAELAAVIDAALRSGQASWPLVRAFFDKTTGLEHEQRMLIALALFGADTALAHEDRLDPDGNLHGQPWGHARFTAALEAEVTACRGTDPASERARRAKAYARRRQTLRVHDDGTATLRITGPAATMVAVNQRIDRAARTLRRQGDERTLDQLRVDTGNAILLYGTITLPTTGTRTNGHHVNSAPDLSEDDAAESSWTVFADDADPGEGDLSDDPVEASDAHDNDAAADGEGQGALLDETLTPDELEHIARVVNALPLVQLQVIVPYNALAGGFPICASCANPIHHAGRDSATGGPGARGPGVGGPGARGPGDGPGDDCAHGPPRQAHPAPRDHSHGDGLPDSGSAPPTPVESEPDPDGARTVPGRAAARCGRPARGLVGEVLGPHPFFITDGHARELALLPSTTLHRLVVDPRDGRLVERTIHTYRPDADMRRQVIAADVYSRAPGSRLGAHAGELDHVTPYGWAGGATSETNLALLAKKVHQFKTDGTWQAAINARRDLSLTTVLGQVVTTRVHDYRTYLHSRHPDDLDARRDLANRLVYAALAQQPGRRDGTDPDRVSMDWTGTNGATYQGPHPAHPTLDDLLAEDLLTEDGADTEHGDGA